jgi:hypothetical protein
MLKSQSVQVQVLNKCRVGDSGTVCLATRQNTYQRNWTSDSLYFIIGDTLTVRLLKNGIQVRKQYLNGVKIQEDQQSRKTGSKDMIGDIKEKCIQELANRHGRQVSRRFITMLENREQAKGKPLIDSEIESLKNRFDMQIYRELLMKGAGK